MVIKETKFQNVVLNGSWIITLSRVGSVTVGPVAPKPAQVNILQVVTSISQRDWDIEEGRRRKKFFKGSGGQRVV